MAIMTLNEDQRAKHYFKRAFITTFAILTAMSAFIAAWMLIWALGILGFAGVGQGDEPTPEPTSELSDPYGDPTGTPTDQVEATCGPDETEEC